MDMINTESQPISGFDLSKKSGPSLEEMFNRMEIKVVGKENEDAKSEESFHGDSDDDADINLDKSYMDDPNKISQKHQKYTDLETRAREDMDFPDEVDTPLDEEARQRFIKYRGIKSIKNCSWDPYENLPTEYSKIWRF